MKNSSAIRILNILELVSKHQEGLTLGEIYRALNMPKATAHDILKTLYELDAVYYKDPRLKNYVIGSKMYAIGAVYTKNSNLISASELALKTYADKYGKTIFITKRIENKIIYVHKYQPSNSKIITPEEIGTINQNFNNNCVGLCYSTFDLKDNNTNSFDKIKKNGYVTSETTNGVYIYSIAVPIYNFENRVCGVVCSSDLVNGNENDQTAINEFVSIGRSISVKLGYLGNFND